MVSPNSERSKESSILSTINIPSLFHSCNIQLRNSSAKLFPGLTSSCAASISAVWQPPQQWPTTVQQNLSVWGSQNPVWV